MNPIAASCADAVAFSHSIHQPPHSQHAYIPRLQAPAAMAVFLREVPRGPILAGKVFKDLADGLTAADTSRFLTPAHPLDRIIARIDTDFIRLARVSGLAEAG